MTTKGRPSKKKKNHLPTETTKKKKIYLEMAPQKTQNVKKMENRRKKERKKEKINI